MLPDAVMQGMGWQPPPLDPSFMGAPDDGSGYGLHPAVLQGLGYQPPPPSPSAVPSPLPSPPPSPMATDPSLPQLPADLGQPTPSGGPGAQLPSTGTPTPTPTPGVPRPDFAVPAPGSVAAAPAQAKPSAPSAPAKPLSVEQQMDQNTARLDQANAVGQQAIAEHAQAQHDVDLKVADATQGFTDQMKALKAQDQAKREQEQQAYDLAGREVEARRKALDSYKVDQDKYWNDIGVGGHIGWYIGIAMSEIGRSMQGHGGGENPVMAMLQGKMKQSIQAQMDKRDQLKEGIAGARQSMQDIAVNNAKKAADRAQMEADATQMLKIQVDNFAAKAKSPLDLAAAKAESAKLQTQHVEQMGKAIEAKANYRVAQQNANTAAAQAAEHRRHNLFEEKFQVYKEDQEAQLKAAALAAKQAGKLSDEESKRAVFVPGPDGTPMPAVKKNGDLVLAADPADAAKIRRQVASTSTYNVLVGQMIRGMNDHGGESSWFKSKDWQKMMSDYKAAVAELHEAYGVQSFREPTIEFFDKMTSAGVDPTSFVYDASAGLRESNQNIQTKMNSLLAGQGYDGPAFTWKDTTNPPPAQETQLDKDIKNVLGPAASAKSGLFTAEGAVIPNALVPSESAAYDRAVSRQTGGMGTGDLPPEVADVVSRGATRQARQEIGGGEQKRVLDLLAGWVQSPDQASRQRAIEILHAVASNATDAAVRERAQQMLTNTVTQGINETPGAMAR